MSTRTDPPIRKYQTFTSVTEYSSRSEQTFTVPIHTETIISDRTPFYRGKFKPCFHTKVSVDKRACTETRRLGPWPFNDHVYTRIGSDNAPSIPLPEMATFLPDIDSLIDTAVKKMIGEFNLLNFIVEFDDIPGLFKKLDGVDDAVLRTNLGALPLWGDIESIFFRLTSYADKYDRLAAKFRRGLHVASGVSEGGTIDWDHRVFDSQSGYWLTGKSTVDRTWGAIVSADLQNPVRAQLQRFGVFWDLKTLWNALPFSFLIDYLVPIGDALASDRVYLNPRVERSWTTTKSVRETNVWRYPYDWFGVGIAPPYVSDVISRTIYDRQIGIWDVPDGTATGGYDSRDFILALSPTQWSNVSALISSFLRRK